MLVEAEYTNICHMIIIEMIFQGVILYFVIDIL